MTVKGAKTSGPVGAMVVVAWLLSCLATLVVPVEASASTHVATATIEDYTATTTPLHLRNHTIPSTTTTTTDDSDILEEQDPYYIHASSSLSPLSFEGIELPVHHHHTLPDGTLLYRHGHGLRSYAIYGSLQLKMYVAALYSDRPFRAAEAEVPPGCLLEFTFLRSVSQGKVRLAWQKQLEWSITHRYDGLDADIASFVNMFGAMAHQGSIAVQFHDNNNDDSAIDHDDKETVIWDQGQNKGSIAGANFQRAFWSMWFGDRPVQEDLKEKLLGRIREDDEAAVVVVAA